MLSSQLRRSIRITLTDMARLHARLVSRWKRSFVDRPRWIIVKRQWTVEQACSVPLESLRQQEQNPHIGLSDHHSTTESHRIRKIGLSSVARRQNVRDSHKDRLDSSLEALGDLCVKSKARCSDQLSSQHHAQFPTMRANLLKAGHKTCAVNYLGRRPLQLRHHLLNEIATDSWTALCHMKNIRGWICCNVGNSERRARGLCIGQYLTLALS